MDTTEVAHPDPIDQPIPFVEADFPLAFFSRGIVSLIVSGKDLNPYCGLATSSESTAIRQTVLQ